MFFDKAQVPKETPILLEEVDGINGLGWVGL